MRYSLLHILIILSLTSCERSCIHPYKLEKEKDPTGVYDSVKVKTEYYLSGQIRKKTEVDSLGSPRGFEEVYYENGQLKSKMYMLGDLPWSVGEMYDIKGNKLDGGDLIFGVGSYKEYYDDGKLRKSGWFKDSKVDSLWLFYQNDGRLVYEVNWKLGIQEGDRNEYYESGNLFRTIPFKNGLQEGLGIEYYDTPEKKLKQTRTYSNGLTNGEVKVYNIKGHVEEIAKMKDGQFIDTCFLLNKNGKVIGTRIFPTRN